MIIDLYFSKNAKKGLPVRSINLFFNTIILHSLIYISGLFVTSGPNGAVTKMA